MSRSASITTRNARKNLKVRAKPYLRGIAEGVSLGYRKKAAGGVWLANLYLGGKRYREAVLAAADDAGESDGVAVLTFEEARKAALAKAAEWRLEGRAGSVGVVTVKMAVETYVASVQARGATQGRAMREVKNRVARSVLADPIAAKGLHQLTEQDLVAWRLRQAAGGRAEATVRRAATDLKAALNLAAKTYRSMVPAELPIIIRHGLAASSRTTPIARDDAALPDSDVRKLIDAAAEIDAEGDWGGDLLRIIVVLAATGARYSQVVRIKVGDVQADRSRIMVPVSFKGMGGKRASHIPVKVGRDVLDILEPALRGRLASEPLLTKWHRVQAAGAVGTWVKVKRVPWKTSSELQRPWAAILDRAGMPGAIPYSLRYSSIVRALRAGLPVRMVAAMHDSSVAMIEASYSRSIVSMLEDMAEAAVVPLAPTKRTTAKVVPIKA